MKKEDRKKLFFRDENEIVIMGFYGPFSYDGSDPIFQNRINDFHYKTLAEAGVQLISYAHLDYAERPEMVMKSLDLCQKYGMRTMVLDNEVLKYQNDLDNPNFTTENIAKRIEEYCHHPAFAGMYLTDEPQTPEYLGEGSRRQISKFVKLEHIIQDELGYVCTQGPVSIWNIYEENKFARYEEYLTKYIEALHPAYLAWAYYPFDANQWDKLYGYFYNMDIMRTRSREYGIPLWNSIQVGGQWNDFKQRFESVIPHRPSEGQFYWNINTSLAFGAKGLHFFPLVQPEHFAFAGTEENPEWDFARNGFLGANGQKNKWCDYSKRITTHIKVIDEVLVNSEHQGVIVVSDVAKDDTKHVTCLFDSGSYRELTSVEGDAMVGCFDYHGQTVLYVLNYNMHENQEITLHLDAEHSLQIVQDAKESQVNVRDLVLSMEPGEGVMVVIR